MPCVEHIQSFHDIRELSGYHQGAPKVSKLAQKRMFSMNDNVQSSIAPLHNLAADSRLQDAKQFTEASYTSEEHWKFLVQQNP